MLHPTTYDVKRMCKRSQPAGEAEGHDERADDHEEVQDGGPRTHQKLYEVCFVFQHERIVRIPFHANGLTSFRICGECDVYAKAASSSASGVVKKEIEDSVESALKKLKPQDPTPALYKFSFFTIEHISA